MTAVEERTSEDSDTAGEKCSYKPDVEHGAVVAPEDECGRVIRLEDAESVQSTPGS